MSPLGRNRFISGALWQQAEYQPTLGVPEAPNPPRGDGRLDAHIVYTRHDATLRALSWVSLLGYGLGINPAVLMFHSLPISLPLDWKYVPEGFLEDRIRTLKAKAPVEFSVRIYLCRSPRQTLRHVLRPGSLVVVGGERRWWPTHEQQLVSRLRKEGHQAFLVESRRGKNLPRLEYHKTMQDLWRFTQ